MKLLVFIRGRGSQYKHFYLPASHFHSLTSSSLFPTSTFLLLLSYFYLTLSLSAQNKPAHQYFQYAVHTHRQAKPGYPSAEQAD